MQPDSLSQAARDVMARPVRLTFPAREPGARKIMADGIQVGHALASFSGWWVAYLWNAGGDPHMGVAGRVTAAGLVLLRERVRSRLETDGPWWHLTSQDAETTERMRERDRG